MKRGESTLLPQKYTLEQMQREEGARQLPYLAICIPCSIALDGMIYVFTKA